MSRPLVARPAGEPFEEKDFYLEEFRGRSVLIAIDPLSAAARPDLAPLAATVAELVRNGTRVLLWWPEVDPTSARRLRAALNRARRRGRRRAPVAFSRVATGDLADIDAERIRGDLWTALRRDGLAVVVVRDPDTAPFPMSAASLAAVLRVPKLVLLDSSGGLLAGAPNRLSFVDENQLDTLLRQGEAEWSGLGDRRELLCMVRDALRSGVEAVNLCTPEGIGEELFSYEGSGTLFTQGDYCHVGPLGVDDYALAERLLERGQREGVLKIRAPEEIAQVLGAGFGVTFGQRHLAGVAGLLTTPYAAERAGEIVGLYTITRFKGEGVGERLVACLLGEAERRGLAYVFACTVDARAQLFFHRLGFERVGAGAIPTAKWIGYEARRRRRVAVFRHRLPTAAAVVPA